MFRIGLAFMLRTTVNRSATPRQVLLGAAYHGTRRVLLVRKTTALGPPRLAARGLARFPARTAACAGYLVETEPVHHHSPAVMITPDSPSRLW
jgi:hypothetical protein